MESDILELATKLSQVQDPASKISYLRDLMAACIRLQHLLIDNANPKVAKSRRTPPKVVTLQYDRINSLPTEILLCIFEQYIIRTEVRKNATLMRVCRRWRVLVYTTPTLWRRVKIEPTDCSVPSLVSWKHLAEVCIARSGEVPLELDLDFARMKGLEASIISSVAKCFYDNGYSSFVPQIPSVSLQASAMTDLRSLLADILDASIGRSGALKSNNHWKRIRIVLASWMDDRFTSITARIRYVAPKLEALELFKLCAPGEVIKFKESRLPYLDNVTEFRTNFLVNLRRVFSRGHTIQTLCIPLSKDSFHYLAHCPNLSFLRLFDQQNNPNYLPSRYVYLPRLTTFHLDSSSGIWATLICLITAPNLRHLRLSGTAATYVAYPPSQLFNTSQSLEMDSPNTFTTPQHFLNYLSILEQCHKVQELTLWNYGIGNSSTKEIVAARLPELHLHNLETVKYLSPSFSVSFDDALVEDVVRLTPDLRLALYDLDLV
ncbi:hypothetical protein FRC20_006684 [Serendipita sp. 405]|nr:hypothetical protein FRC15_006652 [Serendipita sp. 397]KAG8837632.1 hypothetical protein FRC20_006684 [Serendipita sp. 405]